MDEATDVRTDWRARSAATRRERTNRKIGEAARALFESVGYDATTVGAIAERAGVGPATIYEHYGTKAALAAAVFADKLGALDSLAAEDATALTTREAVYRHLLRVATAVHSHRALAQALFVAVTHTEGPPVEASDPRRVLPLPRPLAGIFAAAAERGEITVPTSPEDAAASVTSLLLVRIKARAETAEESAAFVTSLVLDGLLSRGRAT
ncbi:MAG: helix-turn-helix domain containing protein [Actinomycetota bacterium]|nr:helix-turn-helix domain containing protein [Actinomycetota bacterium]